MEVTQLEKVTVFCLDSDEFENAGIKNSCLIQTETPYVAFVLDSSVGIEEFLTAVKEEEKDILPDCEKEGLTVYLSEKTVNYKTDYIGTFELVYDSIAALLFSKKLIQRAGAFNSMLSGKTNFEFVCRVAGEIEACKLRQAVYSIDIPTENKGLAYMEEIARTLAYMIRYHMNHLHSLGLTDPVLSSFCKYAREKDIFPVFQQQINLFLSDERVYEKVARQTAPFIILRGDDTCGGVLQGFADELADSLILNGQAVILIDDNPEVFGELQNMVCKGIVGFQNKALEIEFFRKIHGPKFQFWFDNPLRFENVLRRLPENYFILCQDANYAALIRDYYHTENAIQFPPGGNLPYGVPCALAEGKQPCEVEERPYDIVFMGSYFQDSAKNLEGFDREFYDYMLLHPNETFERGLSDLLRERGRETDKEGFAELCLSLKQACRMVIGHYRNEIISTVLKAGYTLHVYGDSWKSYEREGKERLEIHSYATVEESRRELAKAKIGLNIMSWHKAGMTERIANIMLSGAVCLTEETMYLREHMREGEEIVSYRLDRLEELPGKIAELLENPGLRESIADNARRTGLEKYTWERRAQELVRLSESAEKKALTIYVATHVKCDPPPDPIYVPLHVGRYGKPDLGYLGDDTGENISDLNFIYGELTGLFWIWQNVEDIDYAGLCHYRRYFLNVKGQAMDKADYIRLLEQYDAIVPRHAECSGSYRQHFGRSHNGGDMDAVGRALKRIYPSYAAAYDQAMGGTVFYGGNLVVTKLPILKAYAEWLFRIFVEASEEIDVSSYDDYHKRVYGFLSEQMFYVYAMANGLNCHEAVVGISREKAETGALKEKCKQLLKENRVDEARQLFDAHLAARPDLLLPGSDINGELQAIYRRLIN